MKHLLLQIAL